MFKFDVETSNLEIVDVVARSRSIIVHVGAKRCTSCFCESGYPNLRSFIKSPSHATH